MDQAFQQLDDLLTEEGENKAVVRELKGWGSA